MELKAADILVNTDNQDEKVLNVEYGQSEREGSQTVVGMQEN